MATPLQTLGVHGRSTAHIVHENRGDGAGRARVGRTTLHAGTRARPYELGRLYRHLCQHCYVAIVPAGKRVLEIGCGLGDLLAAVKPSAGVGVDLDPAAIQRARHRHPNLVFHVAAAETFNCAEPFDYILLSDLVNDLYDVQEVLVRLHGVCNARGRLVINFFNHLWRPILTFAEWAGVKSACPPQNWLSTGDMLNLLHLAGWEVIKTDARILWPLRTPVWATFCNRWLAPLLRHFCLTVFMVARPAPQGRGKAEGRKQKAESGGEERKDYSCSVIVPARNEAGNIEELVERTPELGLETEIIFVEGGSHDETWGEIERVAALYPHRDIKILKQTGRGKGQAVRQGFAAATGEILVILDADLSVPPEELSKFYEVLLNGRAEFVNGVRSVYPMQQRAMRFCNMAGNKLFSLAFGFILGQPVKDTLCGTKALFRSDYEAIARNRSCFGDFDPFGDFDLLFGAAKLNLRIVDLPVHYCARHYGETNISRWQHGWLLLKMTWLGARSLKFVK